MITLTNHETTAQINPEHGATVISLTHKGIDILRKTTDTPAIPQNCAMFPMIPYCSYIADGHFNYFGINRTVPVNQPESKHPIHGDGWLAKWQIEKQTSNSVSLIYQHKKTSGFPFDYDAKIVYTLQDHSLDVTLTITNPSDMPLPCGMGLHPYFAHPQEATIRFNSTHIWYHKNDPIFDRPYPTPAEWNFSDGNTLKEDFDTAFGGWDGEAKISYQSGLKIHIQAPDIFHHLILYKPTHADYFCLEPASNTPNAFNLAAYGVIGTGIQSVGAKQSLTKNIRFDFETP